MNSNIYQPILAVRKLTKEEGMSPEEVMSLEKAQEWADKNAFVKAFLSDDKVDELMVTSVVDGFSYKLSKRFTENFRYMLAHSLLDEVLAHWDENKTRSDANHAIPAILGAINTIRDGLLEKDGLPPSDNAANEQKANEQKKQENEEKKSEEKEEEE